MKKIILIAFAAVVPLLFVFSCSSEKFIDGVRHINITIKDSGSGNLKEILSKRYESEYLHYYAQAPDRELKKIFMITQTKEDMLLNLLSPDMETVASVPLIHGKGPGEIQNGISGVGASNGRYFIMEFSKNMLNEFDSDLRYADSYYFNDEGISISFGFAHIQPASDYFLVGHVLPMRIAKISRDGRLLGEIEGAFDPKHRETLTDNLCRWDCDPDGNIYLMPTGRKDTYSIEKYDSGMNPVWVVDIDDGLSALLSPERKVFPNRTFEMTGGQPCQGLQVANGKIYVLRGSGGIVRVEWENNQKRHYTDPIKGLKNGFVDVFDAQTGRHLRRLQGDFLRTDIVYNMAVIEDDLYFVAPFQRNDDNTVKEGSNMIIHAVIAD